MTAQAIPFNLNAMVRVKLTDKGREVHRDDYDKLCEGRPTAPAYQPPKEDAEGWSVWQLWCLMHQMGPHCFNGADMPIETGIEFTPEPKSLPSLPVAIRMAPMNGKLLPVMCCAETGRVLSGQASVDVSVDSQEVSGSTSLLRVSSEFYVEAEKCEGVE